MEQEETICYRIEAIFLIIKNWFDLQIDELYKFTSVD